MSQPTNPTPSTGQSATTNRTRNGQTTSVSPTTNPPPSTNASASSVQATGAGLRTSAGQPAGLPTVAGRLGDATTFLRRAMSGTPGQLRILAMLGVVVSLVFGVSAFSTFGSTDDALRRGEANTNQLVRIQAIHTNLARADADEIGRAHV